MFKTKIMFIITIILFILFLIFPIYRNYNNKTLFANDPWSHMYMTQYAESQHFFTNALNLYDTEFKIHYPTFMRSVIYLYHLVTGARYFEIFQYSGFLLRGFLLLVFIISSRLLFLPRKSLQFVYIFLILGHYYFRRRGRLTFPENYILFFHLLIIYLCLKSLITQNSFKNIFLIFWFGMITIRFHVPSFVVSAVFLFGYVFSLYQREKKSFRSLLVKLSVGFIPLVLALPVLTILTKEYSHQLRNNVGQTTGYGDVSRFIPPTLSNYVNFSSEIIMLMGFFGFLVLLKLIYNSNQRYLWLYIMICFGFTVFLSQTTRVGLNLPVDRMQGFLMITLMLVAFIGTISYYNKTNKFNQLTLLFFAVIFGLLNLIYTTSRSKSWRGGLLVGEFLNTSHTIEKKYYFSGVNFMDTDFMHHNRIIRDVHGLRSGDILTVDQNTIAKGNIDFQDFQLIFTTGYYTIYEKR